MTHYCAVFGDPVEHSLSPQIHQQFAQQFDLKLHYDKIHALKQDFETAVAKFHAQGGVGANVTLPHKQAAFRLCDQCSDAAQRAQAVNTLSWQQDKLLGANTDGDGFVHDLERNHQFNIKGKRVLILGAGGAARGILGPLLDKEPQHVAIANRTLSRANELCQQFQGCQAFELATIDDKQGFDLIINATAIHFDPSALMNSHDLFGQSFAYDLSYHPSGQTAFSQLAIDKGAAHAVDGFGMLVEQAALSFFIWFGHQPDTQAVLAGLGRA